MSGIAHQVCELCSIQTSFVEDNIDENYGHDGIESVLVITWHKVSDECCNDDEADHTTRQGTYDHSGSRHSVNDKAALDSCTPRQFDPSTFEGKLSSHWESKDAMLQVLLYGYLMSSVAQKAAAALLD